MAENRGLELLERFARFEAELLDQRGPRVLVGRERVGLAAGAVQGEHQQAAQALAQRMLADERLELGNGLGVAAERELDLEPLLERDEAQLLESGDLVAGEGLVAEVRQRRPTPEAERLAEHLRRLASVAVGEQPRARAEQILEPCRVERARLDAEQVAGRPRLETAVRRAPCAAARRRPAPP